MSVETGWNNSSILHFLPFPFPSPSWSRPSLPQLPPVLLSHNSFPLLMPEPLPYAEKFRRSPRLIFLSFGLLYLVLYFTSIHLAPLYLAICFLISAFYLSFLAPNGKEWGDQRRLLMHISDTQHATYEHPSYVKHSRAYMINKRGQVNFTQQWAPSQSSPKGVIVVLHGYSDHTSGLKHLTAHWLVKEGYHVAGMDYPGHGRSDGFHVDIPSFDPIVEDVMQYVGVLKEEFGHLPFFLFAESMGGAVAFLLSTRYESSFAGCILLSPMCQIADDMKPPDLVIQALLLLKRIAPHLPITPTPDVAEYTFKKREIYEQVQHSVVYFARMPRLGTAATMLFTSLSIATRLKELKLPFLICHGEDDRVTDPKMSKRMYEEASSKDKTLKLYPKAWHSLLIGEVEEIQQNVKNDILTWLEERTEGNVKGTSVNSNGTSK